MQTIDIEPWRMGTWRDNHARSYLRAKEIVPNSKTI